MIHVIAVSYFGSRDIGGLVASLLAQTEESWRLSVVDNSGDDTEWARLSRLADRDKRIAVLAAPANLGYLGGARFALNSFDEGATDWVIVSNTDVRLVDRRAFERLVALDPLKIGMVAPSIVSTADRRDQNPYKERRPSSRAAHLSALVLRCPLVAQLVILGLAGFRRLRRSLRRAGAAVLLESEGSVKPVYAAHGSFLVFGRLFFSSGGDLDHPLFLFGEEIYLAEQCRQLGLAVVSVPSIRLEHAEHGNTGYVRSWSRLRQGGEAARFVYRLIRQGDVSGPER